MRRTHKWMGDFIEQNPAYLEYTFGQELDTARYEWHGFVGSI